MIFLNASTVVAGTLLLAALPIAETLEFTPEAGATYVRTLQMQKSTEVESATISVMDQEMDAGGGMVMSGSRNLKIVDVLGKVEDGRVMDFVRTYESVLDESSAEGVSDDIQVSGADGEASDLEGQQVSFTWDAEEDAYTPKYVGEESGEDEWLEELAVSLDMVNWLPEGELDVGAKWELSLDELGSLIWYGGRLYPITAPDSDGGPEGGISITVPNFSEIQKMEGTEGQIRLTFERLEEEDGNRIAFVSFELKGTIDQDLAEEATAFQEASGSEQVFEAADQSIEMAGSGELRWDLNTGHLVSLTLDLEQDIEENAEWSASAHGMDLEISFTATKSQTYHIELGVERTSGDE
ncbi:MAG: hypothetical protein JKY61_11645 [Planctomycetes bacterium]|nr:hypothetical protein [Planctomycetota bacterium]